MNTHTTQPLQRLGAVAGILFAVLFVVAIFPFIGESLPGGGVTDAEVAAYFNEASHFTRVAVGAYALALGSLCFLWFLGALWARLRRAEGAPGGVSAAAFGAGVIVVAMLLAAAAAALSAPSSIELGEETQVGADIARLGWLAAWLLILSTMVAAAGLMLATSMVGWRTGAVPRWLVILGVVCALILLGLGWAFITMLVLPIWVLATAYVLFRTREHT